jgi:hypothetical protein
MTSRQLRFLALLALALTGCGDNHRNFSSLGEVSMIKIRGSEISDRESIRRIVAFVDANKEGWSVPWYGVPVPTTTVEFYDGKTFKGSFGIGKNFFEMQRDGGFWSKDAKSDEVGRFLDVVGKLKESPHR